MHQAEKSFINRLSILSLALIVAVSALGIWAITGVSPVHRLEIEQADEDNYEVVDIDELNSLVAMNMSNSEKDKQSITIMSSNKTGPKLTRALVYPQKVVPGDEQYLELDVNDPKGIARVVAKTELDNGYVKELNLDLISGDIYNGTWAASWIVYNTHDETYITTFVAVNTLDEQSKVSYSWTDDCVPLFGANGRQNWLISPFETIDCNQINGIVGVDGGYLEVQGDLNLLNGTDFYFNPGQEIRMNGGSISIGSGSIITKGYLFAEDNDADGQYNPSNGLNIIAFTDEQGTLGTENAANSIGAMRTWQDTNTLKSYTRLADFGKMNAYWTALENPTTNFYFRGVGGDCVEASGYFESGNNSYYFSGQPLFFETDSSYGFDYNCSGSIEYDPVTILSVGQNQTVLSDSTDPYIINAGDKRYSLGTVGYSYGCCYKYIGGNTFDRHCENSGPTTLCTTPWTTVSITPDGDSMRQ